MTYAATAQLIYGYDLGSIKSETGWKVKEVDRDGNWTAHWLDSPDDDPEDRLIDTLFEALAPGLVMPDGNASHAEWRAYSDAKIEAQAQIGVTLEMSGHHGMIGYLLAAHCTEVDWAPLPVDFAQLERRRITEGWDDKLAAAVQALAFTPMDLGSYEGDQRQPLHTPGWLLVPLYM